MSIRNLFGLECFGGKREAVDARPHKFTPVGYPITATKWEGPLKLCSAATPNTTKEFTALIFWFVLHQGKMNTTRYKRDNCICYMHVPWKSKNCMVNIRVQGWVKVS